MIMLMYTIEIVVLMFVVTVSISILAIFFIMKKSKKNIIIKIISVLTILVLTWIGGLLWMWGPLPGYTKEFKKSGNPLTNYELIGYKKFPGGDSGQKTAARKVDYCLSQKDFDNDIKYLNPIESVNTYIYEPSPSISSQCKMVEMSDAKQKKIRLGNLKEYTLGNLGKRNEVALRLGNYEVEKIDFNNANIKRLIISEKFGAVNYSVSFKLEGIENIEYLIIRSDNGSNLKYNIKNGELNSFLKDWGYMDKDGYYGKHYSNPNNK